MKGRRVVVTGVGLVSPCGSTLDDLGEALFRGRSAAAPIRRFPAASFGIGVAAQVPDEEWTRARTDPQARGFLLADDAKSAWGVLAARRALADARFPEWRPDPERIAISIGTGLSSVTRAELEEDLLGAVAADATIDMESVGRSVAARGTWSPWRHLTDGLNRRLAEIAEASGRSVSHFGACAASTQAIGDGYRMVREYAADVAIVGGADSMVHPFGLVSFLLLGALGKDELPQRTCKPFHRSRNGFLLGEGACFLVLEDHRAASERGARMLAEIVGYGSSCDGYNLTAPRPDGAGAAAAMRAALDDAKLAPERIGWVNAHGTGTELNDPAEANAMRSVFGGHAGKVPISSVKPVTGHLVAAAGAIEVASCLAAFRADRIPHTANLDPADVDPECRGLLHLCTPMDGCPELVMTNNYGFGGQNASLILKRVDE